MMIASPDYANKSIIDSELQSELRATYQACTCVD